jgi:hypothetical protein
LSFKDKKFDYITFLEHPEHDDYCIAIYEELKKRNRNYLAIIDNDILAKKLEEKGFKYFVNPDRYVKEFDFNNINIESELFRLSKVFKYSQFRQAIFPEYFWYEQDENIFYKKLLAYLKFYEDTFLKQNISCRYFIQYVGDFIPYNSRKITSRLFADYSLYCGGYLIFDRFNYSIDFQGRWLIENYNIIPTDEERKIIEDWISQSLEKRSMLFTLPAENYQPLIKKEYFRNIFKFLRPAYKSSPDLSLKFKLRQRIKPILYKKKVKKLYKTLNYEKENYLYFPLHYIYDSSLTSMAEPFVNQFYLVELVHRFLPFGYKLVVKEHPAAIGTPPFKKLKKLSKLNNVILIPYLENSHKIIKYAKAVIVITSTVGVEALYQQKPVITFGDNYYTGQNITIDVRNLHTLPEKIIEAINFIPEKENIIKMFTRVYRDSYPIDQRELIHSFIEGNISEKYISTVPSQVDAMIDYCENRLPKMNYKKYLFDV